ncbi:Proline dehydrogenase [Halanaeroarchaeum sp. HSR-CO]|uniref:proline dehydrogenase family protein n=1 Tax=Halanaeroarchaeum sp. HSR-CO TaxID=2866382 RepID=UPI00217EA921|nr:proline dehydrogenase family protein [Halanaeroarchaeum sp. HSR-CO]UWG48681.1 Proline dehydrogenase [Halanaeroarchaeum sp. HSR-CO]
MIPPIANNFVAGESAEEAIDHARSLNRKNIKAIVNLLGEHYHEPEPAAEDRDQYLDLVRAVDASGAEAVVSVKPSQIGIDVGEETFRENLRDIVSIADTRDVFVWVDMEDHETTDVTLDAYEDFAREYEGGVGVCLQSNLKRTSEDLERVKDVPGKIRLVKGAYDEPKDISYKKKSRVNERYRADLEYMFSEFEEQAGIGVGSHDQKMIDFAIELGEEYDRDYEFQMLMGVRDDEQERLAREGYEVYQYVPYGGKWFQYFYRRARERKENMLFALRAVLG